MYRLLIAALVLLSGCVSIVIDTSISAAEAGDFSLIISACESVNRGGTYCRVVEGSEISSGAVLKVPKVGGAVIGGEVMVSFRDLSPATFSIKDDTVDIPFSEVLGPGKWDSRYHDGEMLVLARIQYKDNAGVTQEVKALGFIRIVVLKESYAGVLPIDSGFVAFQGTFKCVYQYTTAGRSALKCQ
jgi:hypothetical protein